MSGCAYYNYFYNAQKYYEDGESKRKDAAETASSTKSMPGQSDYQKAIESAGRMLEYYPNSRWEDDALLLLAKAYYFTGKYRNAIGKIDELNGKYPDSELIPEGKLWKGMSLLLVNQPDSARAMLSELFAPEVSPSLRAEAHYALGEYYFTGERWAMAREEYSRILEEKKPDEWLRAKALVRVGDCFKKIGENEKALKLYEDVLSSKPNRSLRFTSRLQHGIVLRELGRYEEAYDEFRDLLNDGAFMDQFPRVEVEAARCQRLMGEYDDARKRLERLIEIEKRGTDVAAAQWELGSMVWQVNRDLPVAAAALREVKTADRNSEWAAPADSLLKRMETLGKYWQRMQYLHRQFALIDSARLDSRPMTPSDTAYVDSVSLVLNARPTRDKGDRGLSRNDPLARMVEEARKAEADSLKKEVVVDSIAPFDSTALTDMYNRRSEERIQQWSAIGGYYLFEGGRRDSSEVYFRLVVGSDSLSNDLWTRTTASLAYLAKDRGDTTAHDSLLHVILDLNSEGDVANRVKRRLGMAVEEQAADSLLLQLDAANRWWLEESRADTAYRMFLNIAADADSASPIGARALLAAAQIALRTLGQDTTARNLLKMVKEAYPNSDYARKARDRLDMLDKYVPLPIPPADTTKAKPAADTLDVFEDELMAASPDKRAVYQPEDADVLPDMRASAEALRGLMDENYPPEWAGMGQFCEVWVEFTVEPSGQVTEVEVLSSDPEDPSFEEAARRVMDAVRYKPGRVKGKFAAIRMKQKLVFEGQ